MRNEIATLKREVSSLRSQVGDDRKTVVFRALDSEGNQTALLTLDGVEFAGDPEETIVLSIPDKAIRPLLQGARHTVLHGGRAGGKSWTIAAYLIALAYSKLLKILCIREVQNSIRDTVHTLLRDQIEAVPEYRDFFEILESEIRAPNGSVFLFRGMRRESAQSIKGYESVDLCWTEESQALSRRSIDLLVPTIRKPGSRLIWSLNPEEAENPVYVDFLSEQAIHGEDSVIQQVLFTDNCFVSAETLADAALDKHTNQSKFRHVWLGGLREKGRGQIFPDYIVVPDVDAVLPRHTRRELERYGYHRTTAFERAHGKGKIFAGLDVGHGASPTHLVFGWFSKENQSVLILEEYHGIEKSPNEIATEINAQLPFLKERHIPLWVDAAAKGMVLHLRDCGLNAKSAPKWPDSVIAGIDRLSSLEIQITEKCEHTIRDFSLYSWEVDANDAATGTPSKKFDHAPDSLRYALWNFIKTGGQGYRPLKNNPYQ